MGISLAEYRKITNKKNKYGAKPCIAEDGTRCPSIKHRDFHNNLLALKKAGVIKFFLREIPFDLPGGVKHRVDYLIFWKIFPPEFTEVKGRDLYVGRMKRKQVEEIYGITIEVV